MTPINLNKARKARARAEAEATAKQNRASFGRTKGQKQSDASTAAKAVQALDGHKRDR
jgi:hypothetical protein